ncbi:MAG: NACHT and WD repeat domain-containing protein, partial [Pseudonocardiaceae bacterium]
MSRRAVAGWGAGSLVVVEAVAAALINELHGGWGWWVAAAVVVVVWAVGTGWVAYRAGGSSGFGQAAGSVFADLIRGSVKTETTVEGWRVSTLAGIASAGGEDGGGDVVGEGAVRARRIGGDVSTLTTLRASSSTSGMPPVSWAVPSAVSDGMLGPGGVWARTIRGSVTTAITVVGGVRDRLVDAIFDPSSLSEVLGLARFTGRVELIAKIDAYITTHRAGYVLIRGEAGVGKSTLAAYLVWSRYCVHHFTRIEGARSPEQARRSIAAQLIGRWDLAGELGLEDDFPTVADRPDWLIKTLRAAACRRNDLDPGLPLVLVVDGLDEADPPGPGRDTGIPLGLPRPESLPDGVFIVATSRYGPPLAVIDDPDSWHTIDVDGADNRADLRRFLVEAVSGDHPLPDLVETLSRHGVDAAWFVDTLTGRCAGLWIYLRYVLDDIVADRRSPRDVARLPDRLAGYYVEQIERWRTAGDWSAVGLPVLATLVALRRPVSQRDVARFAGLSDNDRLSGWLDREFRSFLDVSCTPSTGRCYTIQHQSFRDLFDPPDPDDDCGDGTREALHHAVTDAHRRISADLMAAVHTEFPHGPVDNCARAELADHVNAAGMLDDMSTDPAFLLACAPPSLLRLRGAATTDQTERALAAYELSLGHHNTDAALWWLHVWARKTRCDCLAERATEWLGRSWTVTAAMWSGTSHRSLTGHDHDVRAVCAVPLADGRTLVASAGIDATVRLWDPVTGQQIGEPLIGHGGVWPVPLIDGRTLLASGAGGGTVRLWDPVTGHPVGEPLAGHTDQVSAVCAVPLADGRTLLASTGHDATVRLWDPVTGQQIGEPLTGHNGSVYGLCSVPLADGRTLMASAGIDGTVRLWDPVTGQQIGEPLTGHIVPVYAVCSVSLANGRTLMASAGMDKAVRLWDPVTGQQIGGRLIGHNSWVLGVCSVSLADGRTLLASAGDKTVRLWEPILTGRLIGAPLTGHTGGVSAVCAVPLADGRTLLAIASGLKVWLWELFPCQQIGEPLPDHDGRVMCAVCAAPLTDGRTLLAVVGDWTVRLWDPVTGQQIGQIGQICDPLAGHTDRVSAVCAVPLADGRTLLA